MGLPDKALGDEGLGAVLQSEERQVERHLSPARRRRCRGRRSGRGAHPDSGRSLGPDPSNQNAPGARRPLPLFRKLFLSLTEQASTLSSTKKSRVSGLDLGLVYFPKNFAKFFTFPVTSNLYTYAWSIKYRRK